MSSLVDVDLTTTRKWSSYHIISMSAMRGNIGEIVMSESDNSHLKFVVWTFLCQPSKDFC